MFMIMNYHAKMPYIAAIYALKKDKHTFLNGCDNAAELVSFKLLKCKYPFFMLEVHYKWQNSDQCPVSKFSKFQGFQNLQSLYSRIEKIRKNHIKSTDPHYKEYFVLYKITEDFEGDPKKPGNDYMGMLEHYHFDKDRLLAITSCDDIISNGA